MTTQREAGGGTTEQSTILVVDDRSANLKVLFSFLRGHGFRVRLANSGEAALKSLEEEAPDLILLDVVMPGINGFETCKRIKEHPASVNIPIIFMTSLDSVKDKLAGFEAGGVDYITKPFQDVEMLARVNTHIKLRRREVELKRALAEVETLSGIIPICSFCKKVRDDEGYWQRVEEYISNRTDAMFSHGLCSSCALENYGYLEDDTEGAAKERKEPG